MNSVNLLPWRRKARLQMWKRRIILAASLVLCFVVVLSLINRASMIRFSAQASQRELLHNTVSLQNKILDKQREMASLLSNLQTEASSYHSPDVVHFWLKLATIIPDLVWLKTVKQSANQLTVLGGAYSLVAFELFRQALLTELSPQQVCRFQVQQSQSQMYQFKLLINFSPVSCSQKPDGEGDLELAGL